VRDLAVHARISARPLETGTRFCPSQSGRRG
jgi:hypothetical protein